MYKAKIWTTYKCTHPHAELQNSRDFGSVDICQNKCTVRKIAKKSASGIQNMREFVSLESNQPEE